MKINFWKIFTAVALVIIFILALDRCRGHSVATDLVVKHDSLLRKIAADSIARAKERLTYDSIARVSRLQRVDLAQKLDRSEILLYQSQGKINELANRVFSSRYSDRINANYKDSLLSNGAEIVEIVFPDEYDIIGVSRDYVTACDSLAIMASQQGVIIEEAKAEKDQLIDLMNYEIALRDTAISKDSAAIAELRADFNAQTHFFNLAIKKAKPRAKVYAGVSALGNNVNPFGGGEVSGMLVTKKDQAFEIGAGFMGNSWYGRAGIKFKISFRK